MTKQEIFTKIIDTTASVCNVSAEDVINGKRTDDVVSARSVCVFWLTAAHFSVGDILACTGRKNHNSVDSIKSNIESLWRDNWDYHMLVKETGERLLQFAHTIGEDFDLMKPIRHIQVTSGRVFY